MKAAKTVLGPGLRDVGLVKNWFTMKEGRIVMKITTKIKAKGAEIEIRERESLRPRLVITGVLRGYEETDLVDMLLMENKELETKFGDAPLKRWAPEPSKPVWTFLNTWSGRRRSFSTWQWWL